MKRIFILFVFFMVVAISPHLFAEEGDYFAYSPLILSAEAFDDNDVFLTFTYEPVETLIISCGDDGEIVISFKTGNVELKKCAPDQSSLEFWRKVTEAFPGFKQTICEEKGENK